jgi:hypothetical protein
MKIDTADKYIDNRAYHMFLKSSHTLEGQNVAQDSFKSIPLVIIWYFCKLFSKSEQITMKLVAHLGYT